MTQVRVISNIPVRIDGLHPYELPEDDLCETTDILARITAWVALPDTSCSFAHSLNVAYSTLDSTEDHAADIIPKLVEAVDGVVSLTVDSAVKAGVLRVWLPFTCGGTGNIPASTSSPLIPYRRRGSRDKGH
jgi:hypothetical protein